MSLSQKSDTIPRFRSGKIVMFSPKYKKMFAYKEVSTWIHESASTSETNKKVSSKLPWDLEKDSSDVYYKPVANCAMGVPFLLVEDPVELTPSPNRSILCRSETMMKLETLCGNKRHTMLVSKFIYKHVICVVVPRRITKYNLNHDVDVDAIKL